MNDDGDEKVRFTVQMPKKLREDAKRNTERGELSNEIRDTFRQLAYGAGSQSESELDRAMAELRSVRRDLDDKRRERDEINTQIQALETRSARLEERISELERDRDELSQTLDTLENMLQSGERMWPVRVKNAADVDQGTATELYQMLKDENPDLPSSAFSEPAIHEPNDWREVEQ